jgi:hypothetical protein
MKNPGCASACCFHYDTHQQWTLEVKYKRFCCGLRTARLAWQRAALTWVNNGQAVSQLKNLHQYQHTQPHCAAPLAACTWKQLSVSPHVNVKVSPQGMQYVSTEYPCQFSVTHLLTNLPCITINFINFCCNLHVTNNDLPHISSFSLTHSRCRTKLDG